MHKTLFLLLCSLFLFTTLQATEDVDYIDIHDLTQSQEQENIEFQGVTTLAAGASTGYIASLENSSKISFNAASISWLASTPKGSKVEVAFSARSENGMWSRWQIVESSGQDVKLQKLSTAYRYRVTLHANSEGASPRVEKVVVFYNKIYANMLRPVENFSTQAYRGVSKPSIVSRSGWGARSPKNGYSKHSPRRITIHHTWRPTAAQYRGSSTVRQIQNYHMDSNGWSDIGYHFLIGTYPSSGGTKIYQGRPETVIGAHTGGANTNNVGVNVVGDFTVETIHPNAYKALIHTLAWLCDNYGISHREIYGHRDFGSTACPGDNLYSMLSKIRNDVKNFDGSGGGGGNPAKGKLVGVIYDQSKGTGARLSGATVSLSNGQSVTTDSSGVFSFELEPGNYSITVKKSGYRTGYNSRTVEEQATVWGSVGLAKN